MRPGARERGYTNAWDKARAGHIRNHPLCAMCYERGHVTAATVVDHKIPHRGNNKIFWDRTNWQSLCFDCHNRIKQRIERGSTQAIDEDGWPI